MESRAQRKASHTKVSTPGTMHIKDREFRWSERTYIMGVINVTPDSFSGDGLGYDVGAAVKQGKQMIDEGADILDIGGESTRPEALPMPVEEELSRVIPVVKRMAKLPVPLSIDTYKAEVAIEALDAGASIINDIWGLKKDPRLGQLAAERGVPLIITSNQRDRPVKDIVQAVIEDLKRGIREAMKAGVTSDNIIIDPGFGFGKTLEQNLELLRRLDELKSLGYPILIGTSRKSMIGRVLGGPPDQREEGTAVTLAIGISKGADIVRVHDVLSMVKVCKMSDAVVRKESVG